MFSANALTHMGCVDARTSQPNAGGALTTRDGRRLPPRTDCGRSGRQNRIFRRPYHSRSAPEFGRRQCGVVAAGIGCRWCGGGDRVELGEVIPQDGVWEAVARMVTDQQLVIGRLAEK